MGCKLFVALQLEVVHHFIERFASGRARRVEDPGTFGATKTSKTLLFNPHQFAAQGRLCRCAPFAVRLHAWYPLAVEGRNVVCHRRSLHLPIWMVRRASYILGRFLVRTNAEFGPRLKQGNRLACWSHVSCVAMLARSSGKANVGYPTEAFVWGQDCIIIGIARISRVPVSRIWEGFWL
jgi:hypothetical protein